MNSSAESSSSKTGPTHSMPTGDVLPTGDDKVEAVQSMFDAIAPRYDMINRLMTFRLDVKWRKQTVRDLALPAGSTVIDLACGTGDFCRDLKEGGLNPLGFDLSWGMLANARTEAQLAQGDALHLPLVDGSVDGATCGFALRNFVELQPFFLELARVIRPGGRIALLDVCAPDNPVVKAGYDIYFGKVVPLIGGLLSDKAAYSYLPRSLAYLPEPSKMMGDLRDAGFEDAERMMLSGGLTQLIVGTRN